MKRKLILEIECEDTACAWGPGEHCKYLGSRNLGKISRCYLFGVDLAEQDGWSQRCDSCLQSEHHKNVIILDYGK